MTPLRSYLKSVDSLVGSTEGRDMDDEPKSKKTQCIEDLRRKILTEALEPGAYLDEVELTEIYGISRPPLREVLRHSPRRPQAPPHLI